MREMLKTLEGFHHRATRWITGMTATRGAGEEWEYPPLVVAVEDYGLHPIGEYTSRWLATIA